MNTLKLIGLGCLLLSLGTLAVAENWALKGEAFDPDSGELQYTEEHYLTYKDDTLAERRIDYIRPDGERFARKVLRYDTDLTYVPSLDWEDLEDEVEITGRLENGEFVHRIRGPERNEDRRASLSNGSRVAYDAAFDRFLVDHFDTLLDEGQIDFDFLSLSAERTYTFRARVTSVNDGRVDVEVGPRSAVLRFFVDSIELTYDRDQRHLVAFKGITNFRRDGSLLSADIRYHYAEQE